MKVRTYTYQCKRCEAQFEEAKLADDAGIIRRNVFTPCASVWHDCADGGVGIGEMVGCSPAYKEKT